ncbi:MAG: SMC family ATPase [Nanoarchaeota archaeon]|nr:SMC family ATPase [Nanoarchaeota archaeon]
MITNLKLKNWRSHLDSDINFSSGTNCFIGNMGTGKTSIMSGICFALFGTFPELKNKKLKLEDVIMKKPSKKTEAFVELEFDVDGDKWLVKRKIETGRSTAELRKNGELIESPQPSKVTAEIERVLKINYELFTRAIYSEQNQLDMFLTIPKGQRMKKIDELLFIDKFESARTTTNVLINKCSSSTKDKRQVIQSMQVDSPLGSLDRMKDELRKVLEDTEKYRKELSGTKVRKIKIRREIETMKEQQKQLIQINEKINTNNALIDMTEADLENLKEELVNYAEDTTEQLKDKLNDLISKTSEKQYMLGREKEGLSVLVESHAQSDAKIKMLKDDKIPELMKLTDQKKDIVKKINSLETKKVESEFKKEKTVLEKLNTDLQKSLLKITELEEGLKDLKGVSGDCPICDSKLSTQKKASLISKKNRSLDKLKLEIKKVKVDISKSEKGLEKLEKQVKELEEMRHKDSYLKDPKTELKKAEHELNILQDSMKSYLMQRKMQEKNISVLENDVDVKKLEQEKIKQLILKRNQYDIKKDKIKQMKEEIRVLASQRVSISGFSADLMDIKDKEYSSVIVFERELETKIESSKTTVSDKERLIDDLEGKKKMLYEFKTEIEKVEYLENQLKLLSSGLVLTQEELRRNFVKSVNTAMQAIWEDVYPYNDFFGARLGIEGGDYVLQLQDSTGWVAADGVVSGGERSIACLVLRIAFSLILAPQLRWIVLDEPTANLDSRAIEELGNVLREKVTNIVDQIFLITHDPALESAVSGYLYKLDREKKKDGHTKINMISGPN